MRIEDLKLIYTPPIEESVNALFDEQTKLRIFSDSLIGSIENGAVSGE